MNMQYYKKYLKYKLKYMRLKLYQRGGQIDKINIKYVKTIPKPICKKDKIKNIPGLLKEMERLDFDNLTIRQKIRFTNVSKNNLGKFKDLLQFIPKNILKELQNKNNLQDCYYGDVRIIHNNSITNKIINRLFSLLNYYNKKKIMLVSVVTDVPKKFPKKTDNYVFNSSMVNSAMTVGINDMNGIAIFRKEEMPKTLIHEIIHYFNLDNGSRIFKYPSKLLIKNEEHSILNLNLNEAYTEVIACIFNIIFVAIEQDKIDQINHLYQKEVEFSLMQAAKIFYLSGVNPEELMSTDLKNINQRTAAVGYYVIKALLLKNFNIDYYPFPNVNKNIKRRSIIIDDYINNEFIDDMKKYIKYFQENEDNWDKDSQLYTGRMTSIE